MEKRIPKSGNASEPMHLCYVFARILLLLTAALLFFPGVSPAQIVRQAGQSKISATASLFTSGISYSSLVNGTISDNGTTMTIPWTVTLTVPKGGLPAGTTIVDDVTKNQWGNTNTNQWMTRSQITAWATNLTWTDDNGNSVGGNNTYTVPPEQVTFLASNGNTYTFKQINEYKAPADRKSTRLNSSHS